MSEKGDKKKSKKTVHENDQTITFKASNKVLACYIPKIEITDEVMNGIENTVFNRVFYINKFGKGKNRTPRLTWAWGKVPGEPEVTHYKGLNFKSEEMPDWLESLAQQCCEISKKRFGFNPCYNSAIIGKYLDGNDQIAFHFDTESFLTHHFCANVTIGAPRDFQFRINNKLGERTTHEIKLADGSVFFFLGLEHALPKRAGVKSGQVRYSISFRNMKNNIGIGNSFYYCRGHYGAIDDEAKQTYLEKMGKM